MITSTSAIGFFVVFISSLCLQAQDFEISARSLGKKDLPIGFPIQTLDSGFAVIEITVTNAGQEPRELDPASLELSAPRKGKLARVRPTKIVPKLLKFYRPGRAGGTGASTFGHPYPGNPDQLPASLPPSPKDAGYSADTARNLRTILEGYEMKSGSLDGGVSNQGYLYVKSKKWGNQLTGGQVRLGQVVSVIE